MKTYNDNVLKEENTSLGFPSFKTRDGIQKLLASMPDDQALREWELYTLEDIKWIDNHQLPIKYWSQDIINSMRSLMWQPAYAKHDSFAPQCCFSSDKPPKDLYTKMRTVEWWWETQVRRDTRG